MKQNSRYVQLLVFFVSCFVGCGSPIDQMAGKNVKEQAKLGGDGKLGAFGKAAISRKSFAYHNVDGRVYTFSDVQDMPASLREEVFRRELLRREIIRRGYEEGIYKDADAEAYIWPRMEKVLEEYYHYKKQDYPRILAANKVRFSGNKAIEKFYEKNRIAFEKEKLSMDDIKVQIGKKIQIVTEKEFEEKKIKAIQEMMQKDKMEIIH